MTRFNLASLALISACVFIAACGEDASTQPPDAGSVDAETLADGSSAEAHDASQALDASGEEDSATQRGEGAGADTAQGDSLVSDASPDALPEETGPGLGVDWETVEPTIVARYDPLASDWMARGWPNDVFRREDGEISCCALTLR